MLENTIDAGATLLMPQGHAWIASASTTIDAGARPSAPQGQQSAAPASVPIVEVEAKREVPQGQRPRSSDLDDLCGQIMALQRDRIFAIRMQSRCSRAVEGYIRTRLGFSTDLMRCNETERKKIAAEAKRLIKAVEAGEGHETSADKAAAGLPSSALTVILRNMVARGTWDEMRKSTEDEMRNISKQLPAFAFIETVAGVSPLGLAVIVGEAGNLSDYPAKGHLWKRLGLAVIDGQRQGNPGAGATANDWIAHGYKASRRAEVYAFVDDVMLRSQWRGPKDDAPGYPIGPYGAHYARKKAEYLIRFADEPHQKAHAENAARRYMAKQFIRDLWTAWRRAENVLPEGQGWRAPRHAA